MSTVRNWSAANFLRRGRCPSNSDHADGNGGVVILGMRENPLEAEGPERNDRLKSANSNQNKNVYTVEEAINFIGFGRYHLRFTIFCGLVFMADSMEFLLLAILSPEARCEFNLQSWQEALITTVVFVGALIASYPWGWLSDKYGRKKVVFLATAIMAYFGFLSAFSVSYFWLVFLRFLVGVGMGGALQATVFCTEFLPVKSRGLGLLFLQAWWAFGGVVEIGLATVVVPTLGWRYLLAFSTVFLYVALLMFPTVHRSPRFHILDGEVSKARSVLEKIASENGKSLPPGRLVTEEEKRQLQETDSRDCVALAEVGPAVGAVATDDPEPPCIHRARFKDLFRGKTMRKVTILVGLIWLTGMCTYVGLVLMTTEIQEVYDSLGKPGGPGNSSCVDHIGEAALSNDCNHLTRSDYLRILFTMFAEFPALLVSTVLCTVVGRKKSMVFFYAGSTLFFGLTLFCQVSRNVMVMFLFGARVFISGTFYGFFVYMPEVFPTSIRSTGIALVSCVGRIGAIIAPFIAQSFLRQSIIGTKVIFMILSAVAGVASYLLPIETKGRPLQETVDEK